MIRSTLPLIAVLGATGAQGGGTARALLATGAWRVRALTRRPSAAAALALARAGAEVVAADLDDPVSLRAAFEGAHGVFAVTNFWEHGSPDREFRQAGHIAQAAREARVAHVVWSTLEDTRRWVPLDDDRLPTLQGHWKVPHLDAKGAADRLFADCGVPTTRLYTSFYWENLLHFGMHPQRGEDGVLVFTLPMGDRALPGIAAADIGRCAATLFDRGTWTAGRAIGIAGEHLTGAQMAARLARALGEPVRHASPSFAAYAGFGFAGADDLANMFHFKHDFNAEFCARRPVDASRALHPGLQDFETWLAHHAHELPVKPSLERER